MNVAISKTDISSHVQRNLEFSLVVRSFIYEKLRPLSKKHNLKFTDILTIFLIGTNPNVKTATDIAKHSDMKRGNISVVVDTLMERGFIEQETVKDDRRQKHLHLTKEAGKILDECNEIIREVINIFIKGIPSTQLEICDQTLRQMEDNMKEHYKRSNYDSASEK